MPRPKEYSNRAIFTSSMDAEKLQRVREICHTYRFEINSLWEEKADEVIERHSNGLPVKTSAEARGGPRVLDGSKGIIHWALQEATPEEFERAVEILERTLADLKPKLAWKKSQ